MTADQLWKGALAESGVGVKKGRGKKRKKKLRKNLNRGQEIGEGRFTNTKLKTCLDIFLAFTSGQISFPVCDVRTARDIFVFKQKKVLIQLFYIHIIFIYIIIYI